MTLTRALIAGAAAALLLSLWGGAGAALAFTDVPAGHRYAPAINELAQLGIVSGGGDGTFRPDDPVTRAQFAKMMCGLLALDVNEEQSFAPFVDLGPDRLGDLYPHEYVGAAYRAGITMGKTATAFSPQASITLAQAVTMVVRAADSYHPGLLAAPPARWWGWWPASDRNHGANIRRAEFADLLARIPTGLPAMDVFRPATRGEVSQIFANLIREREGVTIAISLEGDLLQFATPAHVAANRYYLPLAGFVKQIGGTITSSGPTVTIAAHQRTISLDISRRAYVVGGATSYLKQSALVFEGLLYLSLFDLVSMFDLRADWDEDAETIALFWNREPLSRAAQPAGGRPALVRFEDVTAAQRYASEESLEKLRIVFDYCYARSIPMQLGWVPRYVDPGRGIDNAPAEDYSVHNAHFIYTLDYFADRNGLVGLHGYTHQYGNQISIDSVEFDDQHNTSEGSVRKRLECALADADSLGIDIAFFESPHYAATQFQKKIATQYFQVIYEPMASSRENCVTEVTVGNRVVKYIPTPLGCIDGGLVTTETMLERIRALGEGDLASLFYHPDFEFFFITLGHGDDGYPYHVYSTQSPLHRVVDAFTARGYAFVGIGSL